MIIFYVLLQSFNQNLIFFKHLLRFHKLQKFFEIYQHKPIHNLDFYQDAIIPLTYYIFYEFIASQHFNQFKKPRKCPSNYKNNAFKSP